MVAIMTYAKIVLRSSAEVMYGFYLQKLYALGIV